MKNSSFTVCYSFARTPLCGLWKHPSQYPMVASVWMLYHFNVIQYNICYIINITQDSSMLLQIEVECNILICHRPHIIITYNTKDNFYLVALSNGLQTLIFRVIKMNWCEKLTFIEQLSKWFSSIWSSKNSIENISSKCIFWFEHIEVYYKIWYCQKTQKIKK